jgi:hypothetical protein
VQRPEIPESRLDRRAFRRALVDEKEIDAAVKNLTKIRFRLGMFDPPETVKYARIPFSEKDPPRPPYSFSRRGGRIK